jgi:poly-gamma-glutamate capsule biosynthesis protein CapA/YwtB (metallophosphatase superfamily)
MRSFDSAPFVARRSASTGHSDTLDPQSASVHLSTIRQAAAQGDFVIAYLHHSIHFNASKFQ